MYVVAVARVLSVLSLHLFRAPVPCTCSWHMFHHRALYFVLYSEESCDAIYTIPTAVLLY